MSGRSGDGSSHTAQLMKRSTDLKRRLIMLITLLVTSTTLNKTKLLPRPLLWKTSPHTPARGEASSFMITYPRLLDPSDHLNCFDNDFSLGRASHVC